MRRPLVLGVAGAGLLGLLAGLALELRDPQTERKTSARASTSPAAPVLPAAPRAAARAPEARAALDIDALLGDGSPDAWGRVASVYPTSDEATQRRVLEAIAKVPDLTRVVSYLLATVGDDPTPPAEDPLLNEASALVRSRLENFEDYEYGRRTMVMQKTDKRRWLLAGALIDYAKPLGDDGAELKGSLQAKLIDVHADVRDGFVKSGLVAGLRALGGRDAALILEKGGRLTDQELSAVADEQAASQKALAEADGP